MTTETEAPGGGDDEQALAEALREAPRGAIALAGAAVGLLMLAWIVIYACVFLPRGMVG